jgi:hypothetical protein
MATSGSDRNRAPGALRGSATASHAVAPAPSRPRTIHVHRNTRNHMTESSRNRQRRKRELRWTSASRGTVVLFAAALAAACHDMASPSTGTLSGTVALQDSWANRFTDFSGVTVTLDGNTTGATTDPTGAWHLDGVPSCRHDIAFKKETFGTVHILSQSVSGPSTTAPDIVMAITPWQQAIIDSIYVATQPGPDGRVRDYYVADGHLSAPPPALAVASAILFLGKTAAVSPDTSSYDRFTLSFITGKSSKFSAILEVNAIHSTFGVGTRVFATTYVSPQFCSCYPDLSVLSVNARPFFSNTGPRANVVELIIK